MRIPFWPELHEEPRISIPRFHNFNVGGSEIIWKLERIPSSITQGCIKDTVIAPMLPSGLVIHWCNRQLRCDGCGTLLEQSINFSGFLCVLSSNLELRKLKEKKILHIVVINNQKRKHSFTLLFTKKINDIKFPYHRIF